MNLQMERIQQACDSLKLCTLAAEWSAIADNAAGKDASLADFLESLLNVEVEARQQRTRETLLKFAGLPAIKSFSIKRQLS
jgi:DNA replication protein DnaC